MATNEANPFWKAAEVTCAVGAALCLCSVIGWFAGHLGGGKTGKIAEVTLQVLSIGMILRYYYAIPHCPGLRGPTRVIFNMIGLRTRFNYAFTDAANVWGCFFMVCFMSFLGAWTGTRVASHYMLPGIPCAAVQAGFAATGWVLFVYLRNRIPLSRDEKDRDARADFNQYSYMDH